MPLGPHICALALTKLSDVRWFECVDAVENPTHLVALDLPTTGQHHPGKRAARSDPAFKCWCTRKFVGRHDLYGYYSPLLELFYCPEGRGVVGTADYEPHAEHLVAAP